MSNHRHQAREFVVQALYQWLLNQQPVAALMNQLREREGDADLDETLCVNLLQGTVAHATELDQRLSRYLDRPASALSPVEHAVLLLGAEELIHHLEVPYRVVINEAVELAKTFGGTDGHKYVNGVMDKLATEVRGVETSSRIRR